jgi:hypothetical protein
MKLSFEHGKLYIDNVRFCHYEVTQDGSKDLQPGSYPVEARYAHNFGRVLPFIDGIGFAGDDDLCAIVVGRVRSQRGLLPDSHAVRVLVDAIEAAHETDVQVLAEVV